MDYFYRLLGLSNVEMIRRNQILRQREMDIKIDGYVDRCPQTILKYYQCHREVSRQQQMRFINTPLTEKLSLLKDELKQNDVYYEDIAQALSSSCFCAQLAQINNTLCKRCA